MNDLKNIDYSRDTITTIGKNDISYIELSLDANSTIKKLKNEIESLKEYIKYGAYSVK